MKMIPDNLTPEPIKTPVTGGDNSQKPELTQAQLDDKYLVRQQNPEKSPLDTLKSAQSLVELSQALSAMDSYRDPISGEVNLDKVKQAVGEMNLSLGQAYGLMRDNGSYEGTPQRLVDEVFAKISNLPSSIQSVYRQLATNYIDEGIAALKN